MIMLTRTYTIRLRQDMADLDKLQDFLQRSGDSLYLSRKCILETNLVLEEIFSNFVFYGSNVYGDCSIWITITDDQGVLDIRVEDTCQAFNPLDVKGPDLKQSIENCAPGGLGIHLIKNFTNDIRYQRDVHRNIVVMRKENCAPKGPEIILPESEPNHFSERSANRAERMHERKMERAMSETE